MAETTGSSSAPKPVVGILSIGDMGLGIAKLLKAHDYEVTTCTAGRSKSTLDRIASAAITGHEADAAFVGASDIILSIVPPRDAIATAKRIYDAARQSEAINARSERIPNSDSVVYIDMNAISPSTSRMIASLFAHTSDDPPTSPKPQSRRLSLKRLLSPATPMNGTSAPPDEPDTPPIPISYLDGGIIGGPPSKPTDSQDWKKPSLLISGPPSSVAQISSSLQSVLNMTILSTHIGTASTLKSCFASLTKGLTAIATISTSTAHTHNLLPQLLSHLETYSPNHLKILSGSVPAMCPKAYRWIDEMHQIGQTFSAPVSEMGGGISAGETMFDGVADLFRLVSNDTVLGEEKTESRKRGRTVEDVAECVKEGLERKRRKGIDEEAKQKEKLDLAWRGSWS